MLRKAIQNEYEYSYISQNFRHDGNLPEEDCPIVEKKNLFPAIYRVLNTSYVKKVLLSVFYHDNENQVQGE